MKSQANNIAVLMVVALLLAGCQGSALRDMEMNVRKTYVFLDSAPCRLKEFDAYLSEMGGAILAKSREFYDLEEHSRKLGYDPHDYFEVYLVVSPSANACVHGDDFAIVMAPLFLLAEHPRELIAVLCHEFAHINRGHVVKHFGRRRTHQGLVLGSGALGLMLDIESVKRGVRYRDGDMTFTESMMRLTNAVAGSVFMSLRRTDELEADLEGLQLYADLGLPPETYLDIWSRLMDRYGDSAGRTHPRNSDRINLMRQVLREQKVQKTTGLGSVDNADSGAPPIAMDLARFENEKNKLRRYLAQRIASKNLATYEQDLNQAGLVGKIAAAACGPYDADSRIIYREFYRSIYGKYPE